MQQQPHRRTKPLVLKEIVRCSTDDIDGVVAWYKQHSRQHERASPHTGHILRERERQAECLPCASRLVVYEDE